MRPDRVVHLDAEGQRALRFAQRTVTGVRALVLGTSRARSHTGGPGSRTCSPGRFAVWLADAFAAKARRTGLVA
jgi:hypothetical protein